MFPLALLVNFLSNETGTLDTLNEVLLTEEIHNYERKYYHNTYRVVNYVIVQRIRTEVSVVQ